MAQRARRPAGNAVQALVERLSDDLLVAEQSAFAGIEIPFGQRQADVEASTVRAIKASGVAGLAKDGGWLDETAMLAGEAILDADAVVAELLHDGWTLARDSIEDQLLLCEETLPKRLSGIALDGLAKTDEARADLIQEATLMWGEGRVAALQTFGEETARQASMAALYDKAHPDRSHLRFSSPDALHIPGCSGRGAWWRPVATLQRYAREAVIALANRVSETAIDGMNQAAAERG